MNGKENSGLKVSLSERFVVITGPNAALQVERIQLSNEERVSLTSSATIPDLAETTPVEFQSTPDRPVLADGKTKY